MKKQNLTSYILMLFLGVCMTMSFSHAQEAVVILEENFETAENCPPEGWTHSIVSSESYTWVYSDGSVPGGNVYPGSVYEGTKAITFVPTGDDATLSLITAEFDLSGVAEPTLEFAYWLNTIMGRGPNTELEVFYSTDGTEYVKFEDEFSERGDWKVVQIKLNADVRYIKFNGTYIGYMGPTCGVYLDAIKISGKAQVNPGDLTNISEDFEGEPCPPEGWTVDAATPWSCSDGTDLSGASAFYAPESPKSGSKYITFVPTEVGDYNLTTPELSLGENAYLEFDYFLHANATRATSLSVSVSMDGTTYVPLDLSLGSVETWAHIKTSLNPETKYIRFVGNFNGQGAPAGAFIDDVKIYTDQSAPKRTEISESFEENKLPPTDWVMQNTGDASFAIRDLYNGYGSPSYGPTGGERYLLQFNGAYKLNNETGTLITPELDLTAYDASTLSFWYYGSGKENDHSYTFIVVSYREGDEWKEVHISERERYSVKTTTDGTWKFYATPLPVTASQVKLTFNGNGSNMAQPGYNTFVDMIHIGAATCVSPVTAHIESVTPHTATLKWSAFGSENSYRIAVYPASELEPEKNWVVVEREGSQTEFSYPLPGDLLPETKYKAEIQSDCGTPNAPEYAAISTILEFETLPVCAAPKDLKVLESSITATEIELSWTESGEAEQWVVGYMEADYAYQFSWDRAEKVLADVSDAFSLTVSPDRKYAIAVKAFCGGEDSSSLSNVVVVTVPPTCPAPSNVQIEAITEKGFTLVWTKGGSETAWNISITSALEGIPVIVPTTGEEPTYTADNLHDGFVYTVAVQASCADDDQSVYTTPVRVTTSCKLLTEEDFPFTDGFELINREDESLSPCMEATSAGKFNVFRGASESSNLGVAPYQGQYYLQAWSSKGSYPAIITVNDSLYMREMQLEAGHEYELSCWYRTNGSDTDPSFTLEALVKAQDAAISEGTVIGEAVENINTTTWTRFSVLYVPEETATCNFGLRVSARAPMPNMVLAIDDLSVRRITDCTLPEIIEVEDITATSATIAWAYEEAEGGQSGETPFAYQVRYGRTAAYPSASERTLVSLEGTEHSLLLEDLLPETNYTYQMRSVCAEGDTSAWSDQKVFTTALACPAPTNFEAVDITEETMRLTWNAGRDEAQWQLSFMKGVLYDTADQAGVMVYSHDTIVKGLSHSTNYSLALRAVCGEKRSAWVKISPETDCGTFEVPYAQDFEVMRNDIFPPCMEATKNGVRIAPTVDDRSMLIFPHSGKGYISLAAVNDFIYTPAIRLVKGQSYEASVWFLLRDTADVVELHYGLEKTPAKLTRLAAVKADTLGVYRSLTTRFTATESGDFYLAVYVNTKAAAAIDDIALNPYCGDPTDLKVDEVATTSASLSWTASSDEYMVQYRAKGTSTYSGVSTTEVRVELTGLSSNTEYEWRVQSICEYGAGEFVDGVNFTTRQVLCEAPASLTVSDVTESSAHFAWEGTGSKYELRITLVAGEEEIDRIEVVENATEYQAEGLYPASGYKCAVRTVCTEATKSEWVYGKDFTTEEAPCDVPVGLNADVTGVNAELSWFGGASVYVVRYKEVSAVEYVYQSVSKTSLKLENLQEETEYDWAVRAVCAANDSSEWATDKFTTTKLAVEEHDRAGFSVYNREGRFVIRNAGGLLIREVSVVNMAGTEFCKTTVNRATDYELPCKLLSGTYIVRLVSTEKVVVFKLFVK